MDLTVIATPMYFGTMGAEHLYLKRRAEKAGAPARTDYEKRDTIASLSMGMGSLLAPLVMPKLLKPLTPGRGKFGKALVITALGAAAATTVADVLARRDAEGRLGPAGVVPEPDSPTTASPTTGTNRAGRRRIGAIARKVSSAGAVTAVAAGVTAAATTWAARTTGQRLWKHRVTPDLGTGALALGAAIAGWDFIYYWNHRFMHESRFLWAIHVVHHSSERYNLSTALRQPVADSFGLFVPYGLLALLGIRPEVVSSARGINLLYQYWIHTDAIGKLGPIEEVFNTASHHRVHHGSNTQYLDRNHGSILILWDRLFGTFEREDEPVVYGLTKNVGSFNPARIATHEHADILRDVAGSTSWSERLSFVLRGPGWAYRRHAERALLGEPLEPLAAGVA